MGSFPCDCSQNSLSLERFFPLQPQSTQPAEPLAVRGWAAALHNWVNNGAKRRVLCTAGPLLPQSGPWLSLLRSRQTPGFSRKGCRNCGVRGCKKLPCFLYWLFLCRYSMSEKKGIGGPKRKGADRYVQHDIHTDRNVGWMHVWGLVKFHKVPLCIFRCCCVSKLWPLMFLFQVLKYFASSIFFTILILKYWFPSCIVNRFFFVVVVVVQLKWFILCHFRMINNCGTIYLSHFP